MSSKSKGKSRRSRPRRGHTLKARRPTNGLRIRKTFRRELLHAVLDILAVSSLRERDIVARTICRVVVLIRRALRDEQHRPNRSFLHRRLIETRELARSLQELLSGPELRRALLHGSMSRWPYVPVFTKAGGEDSRALNGIPNILDTLPRQLGDLQFSAEHSVKTLRLKGREGSVGPWITFELPAKQKMILFCQWIFALLRRRSSLPRHQPDFIQFLDLVWEIATEESKAGDWRRQISKVSRKDNFSVALLLAGSDAVELSQKLEQRLHANHPKFMDMRADT
jgi:hypothetical protein